MRRWILEWESQSLLPYVMQQLWETMEALKHLVHVGTSYSLGAYNLQGTQHSMRTGTCHLSSATTSQGDDPHSFLFTQEPT